MDYDRDALITQLKIDEDVKLFPYRDTRGNLTIGIGTNLDAGITLSEAEYLCENKIDGCEDSLDAHAAWWRTMTDGRQRALLNLCYNMGWAKLAEFTTFLGLLEASSYEAAAADLLRTPYAAQVGTRAQRVAALIRSG